MLIVIPVVDFAFYGRHHVMFLRTNKDLFHVWHQVGKGSVVDLMVPRSQLGIASGDTRRCTGFSDRFSLLYV